MPVEVEVGAVDVFCVVVVVVILISLALFVCGNQKVFIYVFYAYVG